MAVKPVIALVGRPNVGKSTLFNRLTASRDAIVADYAGLTRDRHYGNGRVGRREYIVIDTGGFEPDAGEGSIYREMAKQTRQAVAESTGIYSLVISLLLLFVAADVERGFWTVTIAHATFAMASVATLVQARLADQDPALEEAAADDHALDVRGALADEQHRGLTVLWRYLYRRRIGSGFAHGRRGFCGGVRIGRPFVPAAGGGQQQHDQRESGTGHPVRTHEHSGRQ